MQKILIVLYWTCIHAAHRTNPIQLLVTLQWSRMGKIFAGYPHFANIQGASNKLKLYLCCGYHLDSFEQSKQG